MECPYCRYEMKEGYLQSAGNMVWSDEVVDGVILPFKEAGNGGYSGFYVTNNLIRRNTIVSHYCENCKLLLTKLVLPTDGTRGWKL